MFLRPSIVRTTTFLRFCCSSAEENTLSSRVRSWRSLAANFILECAGQRTMGHKKARSRFRMTMMMTVITCPVSPLHAKV